ncbi:hypothetical protein ACFYRD_37185 [Streptomyces hirsutus]|uniref:hypothetical protein n=1 Tax=Streptomyces hirsutus TaxID=35620 RepID=UPI0036B23675
MTAQHLERLGLELDDSTEPEVLDAELVHAQEEPEPVRYLVTRHTMLGPGEMPSWTDVDFRVSAEDKEELDEPDLAENTRTNRDSTVRAFQEWCARQDPPQAAYPCTTVTYTAYGLHLIGRGKTGEFKPDTVRQYMSRIWNWQPEDMRPDPSRVRGKIRLWRPAGRLTGRPRSPSPTCSSAWPGATRPPWPRPTATSTVARS